MRLQLIENIQHVVYFSQLSIQLLLEVGLVNNQFSLKKSILKILPSVFELDTPLLI